MTIYFLRHANAGTPQVDSASDEKRPLDEKGVKQCHDVGRALAALKVEPDAIITSPLVRARQTAELVAEELGHKEKLILDDALRPEASYGTFQDMLHQYTREKAIMVVGHNPSLTEFLNRLLAAGSSFNAIELKKGAVAKVDFDSQNAGVLKWCMTPKVIRAIQSASAKSSRPKTVSK